METKFFKSDMYKVLPIINQEGSDSAMLDNAFAFLEEAFGAGQEMVIFITELTTNFYSVKFISENGSEKYYRYNAELLFDEKQKTILQDIEKAKTELNLLF